jgi:hypothetical protein
MTHRLFCHRPSAPTTATQISCNLVMPESAPITALDLQVQVQTRFGLSRSAKASFPACPGGGCQNGGSCWWSKDRAITECVCPERYHGDQCQNGSCRSVQLITPPLRLSSHAPSPGCQGAHPWSVPSCVCRVYRVSCVRVSCMCVCVSCVLCRVSLGTCTEQCTPMTNRCCSPRRPWEATTRWRARR